MDTFPHRLLFFFEIQPRDLLARPLGDGRASPPGVSQANNLANLISATEYPGGFLTTSEFHYLITAETGLWENIPERMCTYLR